MVYKVAVFASLAVLLYIQGTVCSSEKCPGPKIFQKISACCDAPKVIKKEALKACMPEKPDKKPMNSTEGEPSKPSPYQAMCFYECVFKTQNMVRETSGTINYSVLSASFLQAVNSTWAARTRAAIKTCTQVAAQVDAKTIPAAPTGEKTCNPKPALFMTCFQQNMLLQCASASGKSSKCNATDVDQLRKAIPINILMKPDSA